ncbi:hypothetical protein [Suttonella ornithocola]|uniref:Uncharacterized protein n=1 Tax=Suttonella ornithocola TaxID=279832 RepID=A0A380MXL9_9GAMM|nr:hypothetical protein [Suttonella ornithocola]SUO96451.1 Uncharacterised protein [Suttonella ornithocola]
MEINQLYKAPQANLQNRLEDDFPSPLMVDYIRSASLWARIISIMYFILLVIAVIVLFAFTIQMGRLHVFAGIITFIICAIGVWVVFLLGQSMSRYASLSKNMRHDTAKYSDIAQCFDCMTRYTKIQSLLVILMTLSGVIAALILPFLLM